VSAARAAAPLDVARVRQQLDQARQLLAGARELLAELYETRAWVTLGLPDWQTLCARELPELAQLLTLAERQSLVVELRRGGLSLRAAAAPAGVSAATAKTWTDNAGVQLATVTSLDGRQRPATAAPAPGRHRPRPLTDRLVELIGAEPGGLDVREVCRRARIGREQAGPALCRLAAAGRLSYVAPARRGLMGRYVTERINP